MGFPYQPEPRLGTEVTGRLRSPNREGHSARTSATSPPPVHAASLAHTHGVQRSLYSLAIVSMPPRGYSDVAALEPQVYAHHRHGAGYSSGSSPGPAGKRRHGPPAGLARRKLAAWDRGTWIVGTCEDPRESLRSWKEGRAEGTAQAGSGSAAAQWAPVAGRRRSRKISLRREVVPQREN